MIRLQCLTEQTLNNPKLNFIANTITTTPVCGIEKGNLRLNAIFEIFDIGGGTVEYKLRKLTPRESLRLQDVRDTDIDKMMCVNSDNQLYKQAGNSISVCVLEALFKQMIVSE